MSSNTAPAACRIRIAQSADYPILEVHYLEHEGSALPFGYFEEFRQYIRSDSNLYLVTEFQGAVVGGGGISFDPTDESAWLSFGIVSPRLCGRGFGLSNLLTRLSFVDPPTGGVQVRLEATERSIGFFSRIGFGWHGSECDQLGNWFYSGRHTIFPKDHQQIVEVLENAGVDVDVPEDLSGV